MKRERVLDAIKHRQTDKVPYNIELCGLLAADVCAKAGIDKSELWDFLGNHVEKVSYNRSVVENQICTDEYGVKWDRSGLDKEIGIIVDYKLPEPDISCYEFPVPDLDQVRASTEKFVNNGRDSFKFGKIGTTLFERAWSLRGFETFLADMLLEPEFVHDVMRKITDYNLQIIDAALEYDIDGFYFGDDYGQQSGLLMSPNTWREMIKPYLAEMFARVKAKGKVVALHSCGDISLILDDLIEIGLDAYQTVQPELYDLPTIKERFGDRLTFWGALSIQRTLPFASPQEVKEITAKTVKLMSENGGYIAAPTHQVPVDVPAENILALVEVLNKPINEM